MDTFDEKQHPKPLLFGLVELLFGIPSGIVLCNIIDFWSQLVFKLILLFFCFSKKFLSISDAFDKGINKV